MYDNATTENVIQTLESGFEEFGYPREILTDHGTQFIACKKDKKGNSKHRFPEFLETRGIKHILARVHHPQTNGKIERFFGTLEQKRNLFDDDIDQLMH
ncbi:MAG: transposase family protein [Thermoplasmata archaeon]|nr:transposase family protein [Thermoplasmata archaeon]